MNVKVLKTDGSESGKEVSLDQAVFAIEPNDHVIYEDIRSYLANQRQGNASTKGRSDVRGGGRKAYRQKGTGMARRGTIRSNLLRGGGIVFGPKPRDYKVGITRKMKRLARSSALTYKVRDNALLIVEDFNYEVPRTKSIVELLSALGLDGKKVLILTGGNRPLVYKSGRNIPGVTVMEAYKPATYHILDAEAVLIQESGLSELVDSIKGKPAEVEA